MNIIHIFVFAVLAAVALLLARIAVRLWESRHNEERQLDASAHTVARLITRRLLEKRRVLVRPWKNTKRRLLNLMIRFATLPRISLMSYGVLTLKVGLIR